MAADNLHVFAGRLGGQVGCSADGHGASSAGNRGLASGAPNTRVWASAPMLETVPQVRRGSLSFNPGNMRTLPHPVLPKLHKGGQGLKWLQEGQA